MRPFRKFRIVPHSLAVQDGGRPGAVWTSVDGRHPDITLSMADGVVVGVCSVFPLSPWTETRRLDS